MLSLLARLPRWGPITALSGLVLLAACAPSEPEPGEPIDEEATDEEPADEEPAARTRELSAPVLVVGVDAFEWDVVLPLLRAGELPHLAGLIESGTYGTLRTRRKARSPRIWTTLATGKPPGMHGIVGFTFEGSSGERLLFTSEHRRTKAFWNILGDHGVESTTIGWWVTFPAEPVLGLMVAQTNSVEDRDANIWQGALHEGLPGQVYPPEQAASVMDVLRQNELDLPDRLADIFGAFPGALSQEEEERWQACHWAFRADSTYVRVALDSAARGPADVTSVYLGGTDIVGHRFWAAHAPELFGLDPDSREVRTFGHIVEAYYRYVDAELGALLAAWPTDTSVFVISDHGMGTEVELDDSGELPPDFDPGASGGHDHGEPGLFVASGSGLRRMEPWIAPRDLRREDLRSVGDLLDFCPTLLAFLGIPVGRDMPGKPMGALFDRATLADWPLRHVDTHDDEHWLGTRVDTGAQPLNAAARIEELEKLGYLSDE